MAGPTIKVTLAGDATSLDRALDKASRSAIDAGNSFDRAGADAKKFGKSMDGVSDSVDKSEGKFMASADLLDGLGEAFGLPLSGAVSMGRAFADIASGLTGAVIPAVQGVLTKLGLMTAATTAQATATEGATVAQTALNTSFSLSPIGAVVLALGALVAAGVLVVKNWDTIKKAASVVWQTVQDVWDKILGVVQAVPSALAAAGKGMWDWIVTGLKGVLNIGIGLLEKFANAALDSVTAPVGILNKIPGVKSVIPDIPNIHIPRLASGGIVSSPTLALIGERGPEAVVPLGGGAGGPMTVVLNVDGRRLADIVVAGINQAAGRGGPRIAASAVAT